MNPSLAATDRAGSRRREARAGGAEGADDPTGLSLCHNSPALPATTPAWPELQDKAIGFRGRDAVELAVAYLPAVPLPRGQAQTFPGLGTYIDAAPVDRAFTVAPGMVRVKVSDPRTKDPKGANMLDGTPRPVQGDLLAFLNEADDEDGDELEVAGVVRTFSRASKRRLGRAIASVDWADVIELDDRLALVTLTYPGDWRKACPDPQAAYKHLRALAKRFERATGRRFTCVWKREFQRRGAPHFHMLMPLPATVLDETVREWFARSWYEVVGSGDERHRLAGTGVDWSEGLRMADANRAAAYFTGYSAGKEDAKSYQDEAPEGWGNDNGSVGRWWGMIGMETVTAEARVTENQVIEMKRLLRGLLASQKRMKKTSTRRVNRSTGEISYRRSNRRYKLSSLNGGAKAGFTFLTNDGPALTIAIAKALDPDRTTYARGERRPLAMNENMLGPDGPILYRVTEAAELLGIGRTNVYQLMNDGKVRSVRIGHRRLIPRVALEAFVDGLMEAS